MRHTRITRAMLGAVAALASPALAFNPPEIQWSTVDGGGITFMTGGVFELGGTAGQHDAGVASGDTFTWIGGFWGLDVEPHCVADFNYDGFVNGDDFDLFVALFEDGDPYADFDTNGFVNGDDFDAFVAAFEAGDCN